MVKTLLYYGMMKNTTGWKYYDRDGKEVPRPQSLDNHGPTNQAGLTDREYWEMMDQWEDEKYDRRYNW